MHAKFQPLGNMVHLEIWKKNLVHLILVLKMIKAFWACRLTNTQYKYNHHHKLRVLIKQLSGGWYLHIHPSSTLWVYCPPVKTCHSQARLSLHYWRRWCSNGAHWFQINLTNGLTAGIFSHYQYLNFFFQLMAQLHHRLVSFSLIYCSHLILFLFCLQK